MSETEVPSVASATALPPITEADLAVWYNMSKQLKELKATEAMLRSRIVAHFFPTKTEGTNTTPLANLYVLKATCPIDRKVDIGALTSITEKLKEAKIPLDVLVLYKPELATSVYRTLTAEQLALFDQCLIIKDGSAQLEITMPAANKKALEAQKAAQAKVDVLAGVK